MAGFDRLHPHLRHAIVHELGWRSLRPVQDLTIDAVADGSNAVVLAPTAGGKTEASIFPVLSRILTEEAAPVAAVYVCPIRALLNNQEGRLQSYARMVGLDAFKWHGDVSDSKKTRFRREPCHLLMTTPESLEVMLMSTRTDARALFAGLGTVIIDEVHAFAGDDRGAHLASVLERLVRMCGRDVQRIGLSATVGNPHVIARWLQGSSARPSRVVDPPKPGAERLLRVELCPDVASASAGIAQVARGRKSLVFVESRSKAERVAHAMTGSGVEVFIHHSAVSRADRALAEAQFAGGENTAIVCTSTMELGIDVGDLDQVLQVDAPSTVASFLQRLGRTGRREGTRPTGALFCLTPETLLQAIAILRLADRGWVEDVRPPSHAVHVLAHQIMALILQEGGMSRHRMLPWVRAAFPFAGIRRERVEELLDTMVEREILYEGDGVLSLGSKGEQLYGRKNFFELYAVFSSRPVMRVMHGRSHVGQVQAQFVQMHDGKEGRLCFRLGGRAWQAVRVEWSRGVVHVQPADRGRVPTWLGSPLLLGREICQEVMSVLMEEGPEAGWLSPVAAAELETLRVGYEGLLETGTAPLEDHQDGVQWHTFAGGGINRLLAAGLHAETGDRWVAGNLSVKTDAHSLVRCQEAIGSLAGRDWEALAAAAAKDLVRGKVSKFQPCMPAAAEARLIVDRTLDLPGTLRFLGSVKVGGARLARRPGGGRLEDVDVSERLQTVDGVTCAQPLNPVFWVDSPAGLEQAVADLVQHPVLGLDVETTLDFGVLCLIQLATPERTYVIDPLALPSLEPLRAVFGEPQPQKVIHNADFERRVLADVGHSLAGVVDTLDLSRSCRLDEPGGHSLASVCERELGLVLDKTEQTSLWAVRPLTDRQLRYAALDAEVLLALLAALRDEL